MPAATRPSSALARLSAQLTARTTPAALADYYVARRTAAGGVRRYALAHPVATALAAAAVVRLPVEVARLTREGDGAHIRSRLAARGVAGLSLAATGVPVLPVPADAAGLARWAHTRAIRRKVTRTRAAGAVVDLVEDALQRRALVAASNAVEAQHVDPRYRASHADPDHNAHLVQRRLWVVVRALSGEPLVMAVAAMDGEWAELEHFRTMGHDDRCSDARYLALQAVVEHASAAGARWLMTDESPAVLTSGLLHFQRMTGFRYVRVRVRRSSAAAAPPAPAEPPTAPPPPAQPVDVPRAASAAS